MTKAAWLLVAVAACGPEPVWTPRDAGAKPRANEPAPPETAATGTARVIESPSDVPLTGPRIDARVGDYLLESGAVAGVVSTERGRLVDFGPLGARDDMYSIEPAAFDGLDKMHSEVEAVAAIGPKRNVVHVRRRLLDQPLALHTFFYFVGETLKIESLVVSTSARDVVAVTVGEVVNWGNTPTWVEGQGFIGPGGSYGTRFIARESLGRAYALASDEGRLVARFDAQDAPGFYESARTGEHVVSVPAGGASPRRVVSVVAASRSLGDAALALPAFVQTDKERVALPPGLPAHAYAEMAQCNASGPPSMTVPQTSPAADRARGAPKAGAAAKAVVGPLVMRFGLDGRTELTLPKGCYGVRLGAPGHASGRWLPLDALATAGAATKPGEAAALPVAGRLAWNVTDTSGATLPAKLLVRGIAPSADPDFGDDADEGAAVNAVYSLGSGERNVPPGHYRVLIHRGPEYTSVSRDVTVTAGGATRVNAKLERVVDTSGWISADLHVHAQPSFDAPTPLEDRVRSLAAVGVEVAVATDHNAVTDYRPAITALALASRITSVVGDEVTTRDVPFGHFNVFPLVPGAAAVPFERIAPAKLFEAARAAARPGSAPVVQVNHPRMGSIGYFELLRLDRGDLQGWLKGSPLADMSFDALEVFNGDHYDEVSKVEKCMKDWYALLNAGFRQTATGNSDSHKITYQEAGVPRNWVFVGEDDPGRFDEAMFLESIRRGRVIVSSGPFVRLEAGGQGIGGTVPPGPVELHVRVDAPPWVDVDKVELVVRGEVVHEWTGPWKTGTARLDATKQLQMKPGDWVIAIARGSKPMEPLHRKNATPFGFTNPIWAG